MGRPRESTIAWIFVVRPPRERPIACASAPLFRPPPSGEPWLSCCRWPGRRRAPSASGYRTNDAIIRASSNDGTDCRPWWAAHKRLGNLATGSRLSELTHIRRSGEEVWAIRRRRIDRVACRIAAMRRRWRAASGSGETRSGSRRTPGSIGSRSGQQGGRKKSSGRRLGRLCARPGSAVPRLSITTRSPGLRVGTRTSST